MRRRFFPPEVLQVSTMECGPACLAALAQGWGMAINLGRLRDYCDLTIEGTSIDNLEIIANALGLVAEQVMVPAEFVLQSPELYLPAIVVEQKDQSINHFVLWWRKLGQRLAVMDPSLGRRYIAISQAANRFYQHMQTVPAQAWREWTTTSEWQRAVRRWMDQLKIDQEFGRTALQSALDDPSWERCAALDASLRLLQAIDDEQRLSRTDAQALFHSFLTNGLLDGKPNYAAIPRHLWTVLPAIPDDDDQTWISVRGVVLCRALQRQPKSFVDPKVSPELAYLQTSDSLAPVWSLIHPGHWMVLGVCGVLLGLGAFADLSMALILRSLSDLAQKLATTPQRLLALSTTACVLLMVWLAEVFARRAAAGVQTSLLTRGLQAWHRKLPRLPENYFRIRLTADLEERIHNLAAIARVGQWIPAALRASLVVAIYCGGCIWLAPSLWPALVVYVLGSIFLGYMHLRLLMRAAEATHLYSSRINAHLLDGLTGAAAIAAHSAHRTLLDRHSQTLAAWQANEHQLHEVNAGMRLVSGLWSSAWAIALLAVYLGSAPAPGAALLFVYWLLHLPGAVLTMVEQHSWIPASLHLSRQVAELLGARERTMPPDAWSITRATSESRAMTVELQNIEVQVGGLAILRDVSFCLQPGEHVAIVGRSGAGKSSLINLLTGAMRPTSGEVRLDGQALEEHALWHLRQRMAWVDPAAQLWNRSLAANLEFGNESGGRVELAHALDQVDLLQLLDTLEEGLQTKVGELGLRLSGGEGQRVRLARALRHRNSGLVLLDEAFRGLERPVRRQLQTRAREHWQAATLISVSHDIADTVGFPRVLVFEDGRLIEDGAPATLLADPESRYANLVAADRHAQRELWGEDRWHYLRIEDGELRHAQAPNEVHDDAP